MPEIENSYVISEIKKEVVKSGRGKILFISSEYEYNPQFTFYFEGTDCGWKNKLCCELLDLKNGISGIRKKLEALPKNEYMIIVERDNINPGFYYDSKLFIPERFRLAVKTSGYELYQD